MRFYLKYDASSVQFSDILMEIGNVAYPSFHHIDPVELWTFDTTVTDPSHLSRYCSNTE